jgi:hypothetical protein
MQQDAILVGVKELSANKLTIINSTLDHVT